jgi:uncharacterized protein YkwD
VPATGDTPTHRRRIAVGLGLAVLLTAVASGGGAATAHGAAATGPIVRVPSLEAQVLAAINALRSGRGLATLRPSGALAAGAQEHSISMAQNGYFAHTSAKDAPFWARAEAGRRFRSVGENIAWASPTLSASETVALWLSSPTHRAILLARGWRVIGLGAVHAQAAPGVFAGLDVTVLTADFAGRR